MEDSASLIEFYEHAYSSAGEEGELYARWRRLGAVGKADHVIALCRRARIAPRNTLDVGCGDGALLAELGGRGFGGTLDGAEISEHAVQIARSRPELGTIVRFDGEELQFEDGAYELGILSHVLEHVPRPSTLLAEVARICQAVVIEVPLEANISARRATKREHAHEIGHLQRLDRAAARKIVEDAGLRVAAELDDALPLAAQRFFATGPRAQASACAKWALRTLLHRTAPQLARRLFTVHYACLCLPLGA